MAKAFALTIGIVLAILIFLFFRTGAYKEVQISNSHQGPFFLVYQVHKGPYHKIVPVIEGVEAFFKSKGLPCPLAFGLYLHDPNSMDHDRLESHGGCVFPENNPQLDALVKESGFQTQEIPNKEYVTASFTGSPSLGPVRVYPAVDAWLEKYGYKKVGPVLELYKTTGADSVATQYLFSYQ